MIERKLQSHLETHWNDGKVLIVLGPRQVGKTTLLEKLRFWKNYAAEKGNIYF